jgi:hypothetical protein
VLSENDIEGALTRVDPLLREKIIPFLDAYRDVRTLNRAMNHAAHPIDESHHPYRAMCAVTLAWLARDPDFDGLAKTYQDEMRAIPKPDKEKYEKLVHYLATHVAES